MMGMAEAVECGGGFGYQISGGASSAASEYTHPSQRIAMGMLVLAARDARDERDRPGCYPEVITWLKNPEHGDLSLRCCCEVLFSGDVDPAEVGAHILAYPDALAAIKIP